MAGSGENLSFRDRISLEAGSVRRIDGGDGRPPRQHEESQRPEDGRGDDAYQDAPDQGVSDL
jgi:hypothetical protein